MTPYPEPSPADMTHYFGVLRTRWRAVAMGAVLGLVGSIAFLVLTGTSYTATTDVNINVISTDPFNAQRSASGLLDGATEARLAGSYVVAARAAAELRDRITPEELRDGTEATTVADATILRISFTADSPADARDGADALAGAYLDYRADQAREKLGGVLQRIEQRLADLREELTDANARAAAAEPGTTEANQSASDRDLVTIEIDSLLEEKNALDLINTSGGSVLTTAAENTLDSGPSRTTVLAAGLFGGVLLGIIAAFALNAVNRRLSSLSEAERITGGPILTRVTSQTASIPPTGRSHDELRTARERVYTALLPEWNAIAVVDCTGSSHPSDIPPALATVLARGGRPTGVIFPGLSDDLRELVVRNLKLRVVETKPGGTSYSSADGTLTLHVPAAESGEAEPDSLITAFAREIIEDPDREQLLFIALPPTAPHASILAAGRLADALVLIASVGSTRVQDVSSILDECAQLDLAFLGTVVVPAGRKLSRPVEAVRD